MTREAARGYRLTSFMKAVGFFRPLDQQQKYSLIANELDEAAFQSPQDIILPCHSMIL